MANGKREQLIQDVFALTFPRLLDNAKVFSNILTKNRNEVFIVRKSHCSKYAFIVDGELFTKEQVEKELRIYLEANLEYLVDEIEREMQSEQR